MDFECRAGFGGLPLAVDVDYVLFKQRRVIELRVFSNVLGLSCLFHLPWAPYEVQLIRRPL